jgi:hypothetical protein
MQKEHHLRSRARLLEQQNNALEAELTQLKTELNTTLHLLETKWKATTPDLVQQSLVSSLTQRLAQAET